MDNVLAFFSQLEIDGRKLNVQRRNGRGMISFI